MNVNKEILINRMVESLPALRACLGLTQAELGAKIGVSRCSFAYYEKKKRKMPWPVFLSLLLVISQNETANKCLPIFGLAGPEIDAFLCSD